MTKLKEVGLSVCIAITTLNGRGCSLKDEPCKDNDLCITEASCLPDAKTGKNWCTRWKSLLTILPTYTWTSAKVGNPFEVDFEADGGFPPYHWQLSGDYPSWLVINYDGDGKMAELQSTGVPLIGDMDTNGRQITITVFDESITGKDMSRADNKGVSVNETFKVTGCSTDLNNPNNCLDCNSVSNPCLIYGAAKCQDETISKCVFTDKSCLVMHVQTSSACNGHGNCTGSMVGSDGSVKCSCTDNWVGDNCNCQPESDGDFCSRLGKCGNFSGADNCGLSRTAECGSCSIPDACGDGGTPNVCGHQTSTYIGTLVLVPAGTFQRDSGAGDSSRISLAFHMSQTEITQGQYRTIIGSNPSAYIGDDIRPVENVSWYDILVFCNMLSKAEKLTLVYSIGGSADPATWGAVPTSSPSSWDAVTADWNANGYRLPTEMEWMWAAMGATKGSGYTGGTYTVGYEKEFAGDPNPTTNGDPIGDYAWYMRIHGSLGSSSSDYATQAVGTTKYGNELGLYDMSGNVWEWCWDWYGDYPTAPNAAVTDYAGPDSGTFRVERGGSWYDDASRAAVAVRSTSTSRTTGTLNSASVLSAALEFCRCTAWAVRKPPMLKIKS